MSAPRLRLRWLMSAAPNGSTLRWSRPLSRLLACLLAQALADKAGDVLGAESHRPTHAHARQFASPDETANGRHGDCKSLCDLAYRQQLRRADGAVASTCVI